jgi:methionyl aminopeptidase
VPPHIQRPDYADHAEGLPLTEMADKRTNNSIRVYTPEEIEGIREACRIGREVLDAGAAAVRAGVTCDEIDRVVCVIINLSIFIIVTRS